MRNKTFLFLAGGFLSAPPITLAAADCNFDKPVGSCKGTIQVLSSGGSKPSFTAEIMVRSSAPSCSKVEYYLDSTPQTTILRGGDSNQESLSGSKPISKDTLMVQRCTAYEDTAGGKKKVADAGASASGTWVYKLDLETIKGARTIHITDNDGSISGTATTKTNEEYLPGKWKKVTEEHSLLGSRDGTSLTLSWDGSPSQAHYELKGRTIVGEGEVWTRR